MTSNALSTALPAPAGGTSTASSQKATDDLWSEALKLLHPDDQEEIRLQETDKLVVLNEMLASAREKRERCKDRHWKLNKSDILSPQISSTDSKKFGAVYDSIEMITNLIGRCAIFEDLYLQETSKASELLKNAIVKLYALVLTYLASAKRYYDQNAVKRMVQSVLQISDVDTDKFGDDIRSQQVSVDELARLINAEYLRNACQGVKLFSIEADKHNQAFRTALSDLNIPYIDKQLSNLTKELENSYEETEDARVDLTNTLFQAPRESSSGKSKLMSLVIDTVKENRINSQAEPLAYFYCARNATEQERGESLAIIRMWSSKKYQELQEEAFEPRGLTLAESKTLILELLEHNKATIIIDALDECIPKQKHQLLTTLVELVKNSDNPVKIVVSSRDHEDISSSLNQQSNSKIDAGNNGTDIERFFQFEVTRSVQESRLLGGRASTLINGSQGMFLWVVLQLQNLQRIKLENDVLQELQKLPQELADIYKTIYKNIHSAGETARKIADTALQWLLCEQGRLSATYFIKAVSVDRTGQVLEVSTSTLLEICGNLVVIDTQLDVFRFTHLSVREFLEAQPDFAKLTHATAAEICLNTLLTRDWLSSEITWQKTTLYQYATLYWASHIEHCGQDYRKSKVGDALKEMFSRDDQLKPWFAKWLLQIEAASQTLGWDDPLKDKIEQSLSHPETCLFTACAFGFLGVVEKLCKASPSTSRRLNAKGATGLHLASQYGHLDLVTVLLDAGVEIDGKDESLGTALSRACSAGHEEIVQLLIRRGADRNVQGEKCGTPLQAASLHGHKDMVEILVAGADLDAESGNFRTALQAASLRGHYSVVRVLLENGAEVNALGGKYTKAIELTPSSRNSSTVTKVVEFLLKRQSLLQGRRSKSFSPPMYHETIVQLLLDQRMDINIQSAGFGPALHAACRGGHERVVRMLLDADADSNAEGGAYGTALQAAAINGSVEAIQLLLEAGGDVNNQSGMYNTALQAACRHQREKVILTLLSNKADVNAQGGVYGSALQAAARAGFTKIVRLLLDAQADVSSQGGVGGYCTAIQAASAEGSKQIVEMLIKKGADVNAEGGKYGTATLAASGSGHVEVVQLLVENGAKFGTALQIACIGGYSDIVAYLLEKGADPNADGACFGTALQTATAAGQEKLVQLLLEKKADANSNGKFFGTALQLAAAEGNKKLVRLLHDKGADPLLIGRTIGNTTSKQLEEKASDVNTDKQSSALMSAAAAGHNEIVQIFLEALQKSKRA